MAEKPARDGALIEIPLDEVGRFASVADRLVVVGFRIEEGTGRRLLILRWSALGEDDEEE